MSRSCDATDIFRKTTLLDAKAAVAFVAGRHREAHDGWLQFAEIMAVPAALEFAIRPATWDRDLDLVLEDVGAWERSGKHGPVAEADRTTFQAGIAALEGREQDASRLYLAALRAWRDLEEPWRQALTAIDMVMLLDVRDPEQRMEAAAAREILVRLGAIPFIALLDAALAREGDDPAEKSAARAEAASAAPP